jgi:hypothetical protein
MLSLDLDSFLGRGGLCVGLRVRTAAALIVAVGVSSAKVSL